MRINTSETGIRINGYKYSFIDIHEDIPNYKGYAQRLYNFHGFTYWALIDNGGQEAFRYEMVFFPDRSWFREWLAANPKPTVLIEGGQVKEDGPSNGRDRTRTHPIVIRCEKGGSE